MLNKMFAFEWRYHTRQPSFYVSLLLFFGLGFLATTLNQFGMGGGNILKNGPYMTGLLMGVLGVFSMFLVVNFVAATAMRNQTCGMTEILYSKPINPLAYQLGRFLGSFAVVLTVFTAVPLGLILGGLMPWVNESRFGPLNLNVYLTTFFYMSVPTIFSFSCLLYTLAVRVKSMMSVYLAVIAMFILYEISDGLFASPEAQSWVSLLDPFFLQTFAQITRYWTVVEKNTELLTFSGLLMNNRLVWMGMGIAALAVFGRLSQSMTLQQSRPLSRKAIKKAKKQALVEADTGPAGNNTHHKGEINAGWQHFFERTRFEIRQVIFDPPFFILCSFIFMMLLVVLFEPSGMFGGTLWPLTQNMIQMIRGSMGLLSMIIITYYSAEIVWRERSSGMGDIIDSMPVVNLSFWMSKLVAIWSVLVLLLVFSMGTTILFQLGSGYSNLEISQYLISIFYYSALPWMMLAVLAFFFQVLSPNKYTGMFLCALFILSGLIMEPMGLGHNMFRFSSSPQFIYSDLNGYGGSLISHSWYMLYWGALSVIMSIVGYGLWQRGPVQKLKIRFKSLGYQLGGSGKLALAASALIFIFSGTNIVYNTRVLNSFTTVSEENDQMANYEKQYVQYLGDPVPVISKFNGAVDIYPKERKVVGNAQLELINRTSKPIDRFLVTIMGYTPLNLEVEIEGGKLGPKDNDLNVYWFEFDEPMLPGETRTGRYQVTRHQQGFVDQNDTVQIVENGTFLNNTELFPRFGYQKFLQILDPLERKNRGLPPTQRQYKLENTAYYNQNIFGAESGHMEFETTVSTSPDQIAIAPGYLQREWTEDGRRYFHYKMDAPIENYFSYQSGRYEILKAKHKGVDIEIYYHKSHGMNVARMQEAIVDSIDYFSANFGPYQHRQARIIEFPGYRNFAQSFPNTIAFSERIGFTSDLRDEDVIDQVYYVTAHEMAHQWWGGQVDGANVQGGTMIVETLAQYSALMLSKQKYGEKKLRGILKHELDKYLRGRTRELVEELPLMRVENQDYIHYRKGSVAVMSLVDLLGEERMNRALNGFLGEFKYSQNPYPTTMDLQSYVSMDTTVEEKKYINSIFEQISLYDLKATEFTVEELDNSQFEVTLIVNARRVESDGQGIETEVELSELIDIGLFLTDPDDVKDHLESDANADVLYLQKHLVTAGENTIKLIVNKRPVFAGIDPFVKLIDRDSVDNIIRL